MRITVAYNLRTDSAEETRQHLAQVVDELRARGG